MARIGKYLSLSLVVILAVSSLLMIKPINAETVPKPSVPEFTVRFVDNSYDVPTTTSIDPYTGKTITNQGYHVENKSTELEIRNQPFTPFQISVDGDSKTINLFYNIHIKGHYSPNWNYYQKYNGSSNGNVIQNYDSPFTIVPIDDYLPNEGTIDIQVEAMVGYEEGIVSVPGAPGTARVIRGENSGWSFIQSITIPTTNNPSPSPTVPEFPITLSLVTVLVAVSLLLIIGKRKLTIGHMH
jgi:hypothetical protein